jgi:chemotaxis protein CheD
MTSYLTNFVTNQTALEPPKIALPGFDHINRYWDKSNSCYAAKILPGDYYVTIHDELIVTTLGSCVSVCMRDRIYGIGGMNHFMLPTQTTDYGGWKHSRVSLANRYGNYAMENLINDILKNGGERRNLEVKVFGGGKILAQMTDIGKRNIDFIENYIETENLLLAAKDIGNIFPRKVVYHPLSGKVRVKKLRSIRNETIVKRETQYLKQIENEPVAGDIELFK